MKTAVNTVFVGKGRAYNERFLQMCSHHLVEPVACTPGAGWEKGQVENQVGTARGRLFVPRPRGRSYRELNTWLVEQCIREAKRCQPGSVLGRSRDIGCREETRGISSFYKTCEHMRRPRADIGCLRCRHSL